MPLRVAMLADMPEPGAAVDGGVQGVADTLISGLARKSGLELHVIKLNTRLEKPVTHDMGHYQLHVLPMAKLGTATLFARDQQILDRKLREVSPDILHSQGAGHYGILAARAPYPAVTTIHGILSEEIRYRAGIRNRIRAAAQSWLSDVYCIRRATHTILISPYVADYYGPRLSGEHYLIPNPVKARFFEILRHGDVSQILFAGRVTERKGVRDLLLAVSRLGPKADVRVVLAGSLADHGYVSALKATTHELGIAERVTFAGGLSPQALSEALASCSCLVLPSYQETAPLIIQEAMAAGVPVIATAICGVPYQLEHERTGFLYQARDVGMLTSTLALLLEDDALRRRVGEAAREEAMRRFHVDMVADQTIEVYRHILGMAG
jgi:glycosyltransferase involved in cell wall biosynthesis